MWINFFTVAFALAIGLGSASLIIEAKTREPRRRYARRRAVRARA